MNAYIAQIRMNLRLTFRDRSVLFFSYLFPLVFFFMFGQIAHAEQGGAPAIVNMVLTIGVLGSGFFGAAMRAIGDRERNILRRFKVAPISAGPILVSSLVTGLVTYLPLVVLVLALARTLWNMPAPTNPVSLFLFLAIGVVAFRAMGGIIASVANSMQEGQVLVQLFYTPMLLLGGATIPLAIMPQWLQITAQFLPSTHFSTGIAGILLRHETLEDNLPAAGALLLTAVVATFIGAKLFRWDKDEKLKPSAKLWVLAVLAPFFAMGVWQAHAKTNIEKSKILARDLNRNRSLLIRDVRLFVGDGTVTEQASVLIKDGKIAQITASAPDSTSSKAEEIEGGGKTLLPGLIDVNIKSFRTYPKAALALGCFCTALLGMTLNDLTRSPEAQVDLVEAGQALTVQGRVAMVRIESGDSLIRVERTDGTGKYEFMTAAARDLAEQGFTRSTMNPGDRVIVTGVSIDGAKLRADKITKPDGSILFDRAVLAATR